MRQVADCFIAANAIVLGDVVLAAGVNIWYGCVVRGDLARLTFGPRVNLQDGCVVHADGGYPQEIEEGVVVGHGVVLHGNRIGRDSLIGVAARILGGCDIGKESLIAAGTVVPEGRTIPPRSVVMGIPGKVIRAIKDEELEKTRRINAHYLDMAARHARGEFRQWGAPA